MADNAHSTDPVQLPETTTPTSALGRATTAGVWALFALSLLALGWSLRTGVEWRFLGLRVDGLTTVVWVVVTFFSGIVHSYSRRYMAGEAHIDRFFALTVAFTLSVMTVAAADHVALFLVAWLAMGLAMASLIGHVRGWRQARAAASLARRHFLAGSGILTASLALLAWTTGSTSITTVLARTESLPEGVVVLAIGGLFLAAMVQSALVPFHGWLLSSMTAPTPASALMHAGFVNAGAILLTRFAPLFAERSTAMTALVVVGAASALLGQAMLLVQSDTKRELGASTVAQMGFMILQCGLGFFAAAVTHLALHGFYKAYLFLSSGGAVEQTAPPTTVATETGSSRLAISLLAALAGGAVFVAITGKGASLDSGLLLVLVVVLTTLQATRGALARTTLPTSAKLLALPLVVVPIAVYGFVFEAVSAALAGVPMTAAPTDLTAVHVAVAGAFLAAYVAVESGWYRASDRLYVALLNRSQPAPETVLTSTEEYNDT